MRRARESSDWFRQQKTEKKTTCTDSTVLHIGTIILSYYTAVVMVIAQL